MSWEYEVTELSEGFSATVYDDNGRMVADHLSEEHARLIAAAPELLVALDELVECLTVGYVPQKDGSMLNEARALIAKAGGQP